MSDTREYSLIEIFLFFSRLVAGKSQEEAMNDYITKVKQLLEEAAASCWLSRVWLLRKCEIRLFMKFESSYVIQSSDHCCTIDILQNPMIIDILLRECCGWHGTVNSWVFISSFSWQLALFNSKSVCIFSQVKWMYSIIFRLEQISFPLLFSFNVRRVDLDFFFF